MTLENRDQDLTNQLTAAEVWRYSRQIVIPEFGVVGQQKLKAAKVLVVGAGGLGSPLLLYLAAAGIGTLGIIDFDRVDESNLQRQVIYTTADVGKSKARTAGEKVKALNPFCQVNIYEAQLERSNALEIIRQYDVVADASDNFATRYLVNDACVLSSKPLVFGSIYRFEGQVSVFNAPQQNGERSPHYRDLFPVPGDAPNCAESGVIGILPGIIGSLQANEVIKIITSLGEILAGKLMVWDALHNETRVVRFRKNPDVAPITQLAEENPATCITNEKESDKEKSMKEVTVQELKELRDSGADFQLIDVREPHEYAIANLNGELIPLGQVEAQADKIARDKQVIVQCRSGARSGNAVRLLEEKFGYTNLYNLKGGILAWSDEVDPSVPKY